ncbi:GspH/FimT family pseudopilin [Pseudoxanthomonas mexicana]|uniref:GspH/FimT family pseudopilin n=1 Tax=Pseudoxanthomonas mexicana TaxID=128785 RepID=UPI00398A768D
MSRRQVHGFTLIELMVVVAVVAVLAAVAFPNLNGVIRANRVATASNEMIASLALARSEAVRGTRGAGVCSSANGTTCGGNWNDGWIVWQDTNGNGAFSAGVDQIVRYTQGRSTLTLATEPGEIFFDPRGRPDAARGFTVTPTGYDEDARGVCLSATGQARVVQGACP